MKKILCLMLVFSCSAFALEQNPVAPPKVDIADKYGVNLQTGQLARTLNTVSIGGELGLTHQVQLYTDLLAENPYYGFVDGFAGSVTPKNISENALQVITDGSGYPMFFRDTGGYEYDNTKRISVMRAYGPAGSQDFLVYQNDVLNRDASALNGSGITFKSVGDARHTLIRNADKSYLWTTPDGTTSKYSCATFVGCSIEITYPNGFKVRVAYKAVTTNTGFMLKYQLFTPGLTSTPGQIVGINLANQYCSADAESCPTSGWPTATFTWPLGTPGVFKQLGLPSSSYLIKLVNSAGTTEIQYQPENVCITALPYDNYEDPGCVANPLGDTKWSPRLRSIKTPESTIPNYQYAYKNIGKVNELHTGSLATYSYWQLSTRSGQIVSATLNGSDTEYYFGPETAGEGAYTRGSYEVSVESQRYELNVINEVMSQKSGTYEYYPDLRKFVQFHTPLKGQGPKKHYYYEGPKGNLSKITAVTPSGEVLLQKAIYGGYDSDGKCRFFKTCNKPTEVTDANNNVTNYYYDSLGRFANPVKILGPAAKAGGIRPGTVYNYVPMYASYKRNGETITQDPDPVWMLNSEHTCISSVINDTGCDGGDVDTIRTTYYYGPQTSGVANNLLLRGKSVTADGNPSVRVTCYEYDKTGKLMGETKPKGNSTDVQSCQ